MTGDMNLSNVTSVPAPASGKGASSRRTGEHGGVYENLPLKNKLNVLVADGDRCCRMIQQAQFWQLGTAAVTAENGRAVLDLIAAGVNFDLIVIDMILPVINGPETVRQLRAMGVRTKIVGIHSSSYEREKQAFFDAGVNEFFEKPLSPGMFIPILMELDGQ